MPKLPTPQSRPILPEPIFTAETQGAAVGRALADLGQDIGRVGQHLQERQAQQEISQLNAEFAKAQAELTVEWQETLRTADPNDPDVATRFQERVEERLSGLETFANTRESNAFFTRAAAGLGASFLTTTASGQAALRETAAVQNFQTMLNQHGDTVRAMPAAWRDAIAVAGIQLEGLVQAEGLSRDKALVLETAATNNIAMTAAFGLIENNPSAGRAAVERGDFSEFIDGQDKQRLLNFADAQENAQRAARERELDRVAKEASSDFLGRVVAQDGSLDRESLPRVLGAIANDPRYRGNPAEQRAVFNMVESLADEGEGDDTDMTLFESFRRRALLPPGDPNRLTREEIFNRVNAGLTFQDANFLVDRLDLKDTPEGRVRSDLEKDAFTAAKVALTGSATLDFVEDPNKILAFQNWKVFAQSFIQQNPDIPVTELYAADGPLLSALPRFQVKSPIQVESEVFPTLDPESVEQPGVEDPFRRGTQIRAQEGETPEEFLKRTGGQ